MEKTKLKKPIYEECAIYFNSYSVFEFLNRTLEGQTTQQTDKWFKDEVKSHLRHLSSNNYKTFCKVYEYEKTVKSEHHCWPRYDFVEIIDEIIKEYEYDIEKRKAEEKSLHLGWLKKELSESIKETKETKEKIERLKKEIKEVETFK